MIETVVVTCAVIASAGYLVRCAYKSIRGNCGCGGCDIASVCASKRKPKL